jgi:hypothetical protein
MMNCRACIAELVECARAGLRPGAQLQGHLRECPPCRERWEGERALSAQFRKMRANALARRQSDAQRERIMRAFEQAPPSAIRPSLRWVLGLAAVVVLAVALGQIWRNRLVFAGPAKNPTPAASQESAEESVSSGDFIDVPYAPPLATGEFVRVVRTELRPPALARMGIYVDAGETDEISADVLLGEDGFPRGVRMLEAVDF